MSDLNANSHNNSHNSRQFKVPSQLLTEGVGKNVAVDRVLELLRAEREYVQLHRDTTASRWHTFAQGWRHKTLDYQEGVQKCVYTIYLHTFHSIPFYKIR